MAQGGHSDDHANSWVQESQLWNKVQVIITWRSESKVLNWRTSSKSPYGHSECIIKEQGLSFVNQCSFIQRQVTKALGWSSSASRASYSRTVPWGQSRESEVNLILPGNEQQLVHLMGKEGQESHLMISWDFN